MLEFIIVMVIAGVCIYMENADRRSGRYPRDWK